jgi:PAS domain S-box-containing protein
MNDREMTREELIKELAELHQRIAALESARKSQEARELRASLLLESAPLGIHECDIEGRITFVNSSHEATTGYSADELLGTYIWDRIEPGPQRDALPAYLKRLVAEPSRPEPYICRNVKKSGEVFDVRVDWNYKRDSQGDIVGFVSMVSDITEQKRTEEALRQSEARYRTLTESTSNMIYIVDRSGDVVFVNQSAARFLGCDVKDAVGKQQEDLFPAGRAKQHAATIGRLFETGETFEKDETYGAGSNAIWLNTRLIPLKDDRGQTIAVMGVSRNITDSKRAERALQQAHDELERRVEERTAELAEANKALQQSRDEFRTIYDHMSDAVVVVDAEDAMVVRANSAFCAMLGCSEADLPLLTPAKIHSPESLPGVLRYFESLKQDGIMPYSNTPLVRSDGSIVYADVVSEMIVYNGRSCWISFFHDVTERKRVEEAVLCAKQQWERTFDSVPDLIALLDRSSRIVRVNQAMADRMSLTPQQCVGLKCCEAVHGLHSPPEFCPNALTLEDGKGHHVEMHEDRLGGDFLVTTTPIFDENNQFIGSVHVARDITDRKQAQEALRQSEEKYRGLIDICPDSVVVSDLTGKILFVSKEAWTLMAVPEQADLAGQSVFDYVIKSDRVRLATSIAEATQRGRRGPTEYTLLRPNGTTVPAELLSTMIPDAQGKPMALMSMIRDISNRKQTEEALRRSEEQYRGLVEICPDSIIVSDLTGKSLFASKQTWRLLRARDEEVLIGESIFDQVIEADRPRMAESLAELIQIGRHSHTEYTIRRRDGTTVPTEISSAIVRDAEGRPIALMAIVRDISDRKQAEEALRQSEEKYRGLVEICPDSVVVADLAGKAVFVSPQTWTLLAIPESEELVGRSVYSYVVEGDRTRLATNIVDLVTVGKQKHMEYGLLRSDGAAIPAELSSAVIRDAQGQPTSLMAIIRDISDRKQAEETLKREHRTLKHLLQSSDHERQLIAYEIHDGLTQQLAGAIMQLETYSYQKDHKPKEATRAYDAALTMLRQAHFEARRLISGVRPPILDESGIVAAVAHLVNEHRLQKGPTIEFRSEVAFDRLAPILENAIYRIVQEGLANACRHSKSDKVRVELVQRNDILQIVVKDWGIGFDPNKVKDDRFGLEGIRERARLLAGHTVIETKRKHGTCITVELPLALRKD